jgi:GT2 family glycosyltransferase
MERNILFGLPHTGDFSFQTVNGIFTMLGPILGANPKININFMMVGHSLVYDARNMIAEKAMNEGFTHVFFLDSDMVVTPNTLIKLLADEKDIVSGMAFKRVPPFEPCFYKEIVWNEAKQNHECVMIPEWEKDSLVEIAAVGMACALIKTEVLKAVKEKYGSCFHPGKSLGEDIAFCRRAVDLGYKIFVDTSLSIGHVGSFVVTDAHWRATYENSKRTTG